MLYDDPDYEPDDRYERDCDRADQRYDAWKDEHPPNCVNVRHGNAQWSDYECMVCKPLSNQMTNAARVFDARKVVTNG